MKRMELTEKHKKILAWASLAVFVLLSAFILIFIGRPMIRFAASPDRFRAWVGEKGLWSRFAYMGMVFLQVLVALIPGEPLEIAGGYAFGPVEGTLLCLFAAALGSVAVFFFVRLLGIKLVEVFFSKEKIRSLRFLRSSPQRDLLFLLVFTVPGTPKDLLCYMAGLTDIKFPVWLLICSLGRIPSILTSTLGGDALGTKNYWFAAIVFIVTLLISGGGLLLYRKICKKHSKE